MLCPKGHEVPPNSGFCPKCGAKLNGAGMELDLSTAEIPVGQTPLYTVTLKGAFKDKDRNLATQSLMRLTGTNYVAFLSMLERKPEVLLGRNFTKETASAIKRQIEPLGIKVIVTSTAPQGAVQRGVSTQPPPTTTKTTRSPKAAPQASATLPPQKKGVGYALPKQFSPIPSDKMVPNPYVNNPFRVLGLYANATRTEVRSTQQRMRMRAKAGATSSSNDPLSFLFQADVSESAIRDAFNELENPTKRLNARLFWFDKSSPEDDEAIESLLNGDVTTAIGIWSRTNEPVAAHNLAVLLHCIELASCTDTEVTSPPKPAFPQWRRLL